MALDQLDQLVSEIFGDAADALGEEGLFVNGEDWDSLKHVELVVGVQSRFGVDLSAEDIARMTHKAAVRAVLAERGHHG